MAIFHLTARTASRAGGQSATAHFEYISRSGKYSNRGRDRLVFCESGNLPEWAAPDAQTYWQAADAHERANGRLFKSIEFALPRELSDEECKKLAQKFATEVTSTADGKLPFSLALHEGRGHNPHAHLMVSERCIDGHDRSAELWFKRAATGKKAPCEAGTKKTELLKPPEWLIQIRLLWAQLANQALEACKSMNRIDHRSNRTLGIHAKPGQHAGPHGFKRRTHALIPEPVHLKRGRQLEIIRTERELDELKATSSNLNRQAARARLSDHKTVASTRVASMPKANPSTPTI